MPPRNGTLSPSPESEIASVISRGSSKVSRSSSSSFELAIEECVELECLTSVFFPFPLVSTKSRGELGLVSEKVGEGVLSSGEGSFA